MAKQRDIGGLGKWCDIPFYVVVGATATALSKVSDEFKDFGLQAADIRGQSSGNATTLAPFILEDMKGKPKSGLLYLTGDKNHDTISRIVDEGGIELESLQVYKSRGSPAFRDNLSQALQSLPTGALDWWIVYFSSSATAFATPILQNYFSLTEPSSQQPVPKIAAIGPTTYAFLTEELQLRVDVLAQKPTSDEVIHAIRSNDQLSLVD